MDDGKEKEESLVICPIESVWARSYSGAYDNLQSRDSIINEIEEKYERLFQILTTNQIGFDYGEEVLMEKYGSVEEGVLRIGQCTYKRVIVCGMYTIRSSTMKLLKDFQNKGGEIVFIGNVPKYIDVELSHEADNLADKAIKIPFEESQIVKVCEKGCWVDVEGEGAKVFCV